LNKIASLLDACIAADQFASAYIYDKIYNAVHAICKNSGIAHAIANGVVSLIALL
jgi:hypothetical protein